MKKRKKISLAEMKKLASKKPIMSVEHEYKSTAPANRRKQVESVGSIIKGGHYKYVSTGKIFKIVNLFINRDEASIAYRGKKHENIRITFLLNLLKNGIISYIGMTAYGKGKKEAEFEDSDISEKSINKNSNEKIKLDSKKCRKFISSLSDAERYYSGHVIDIVLALRQLIGERKDGKMPVSEFCDHFKIKAQQYVKFIGGDYEYGLIDTVRLTLAQEIIIKRENDKRI